MNTKEQLQQPSLEKISSNTHLEGVLSLSWLQTLWNSSKEKIAPQKDLKLWSSRRYTEAFQLATTPPEQAMVTTELHHDLETYCDEYAALFSRVEYTYGKNGVQNRYGQGLSDIAQNFLQDRELKGLDTTRAYLEYQQALFVEGWMDSAKPGQQLITVSPRGNKSEGYPGKKPENYVFINIFTANQDETFTFTQYRSYDLNQELPTTQQQFVTTLGGVQMEVSNQTNFAQPEHSLIHSVVLLNNTASRQQLEEIIYTNKQNWKVSLEKDLPQVNQQLYEQNRNKILALCTSEFSQLQTSELNLEEKITYFDLLIDLSKKLLRKWVEDHAQNYDPTKRAAQPYSLDDTKLQQLLTNWRIECKKHAGETLTSEEKNSVSSFLSTVTLNPALPMNRMASMAHCIVGSPMSMMNPELLAKINLGNLQQADLIAAIGAERAKLWKPGTCLNCDKSTLVGECSICLHCELQMSGSNLEGQFKNTQNEILDESGLFGSDKQKAQQLLKTIERLLFKSSVNPEQFWRGDWFSEQSDQANTLHSIKVRMLASSNKLVTLQEIALELLEEQPVLYQAEEKFPELLLN